MKALRWMLSVPGAMLFSFIIWGLTQEALSGVASTYGGGFFRSVLGVMPIVISTTIPAVGFVVSGVTASPSKGRLVSFVFFGLSLLMSAGGVEMLQVQDFSHQFWVAALVGQVIGGLLGLALALRLQQWRKKRPNQTPEPTSPLVTIRAGARVAPSAVVAHL